MEEDLVRGCGARWLNHKIKKLIKERDYFWKKAKQNNTELNWSNYKTLRNKVTTEIRRSKVKYHRNLVSENSGSPDKIWITMKKLIPNTKGKSVSQVLMCINGNLSTNFKEIANCFCSFFTNVGKTIVSDLQQTINHYRCPESSPFTDKVFNMTETTQEEAAKALQQIYHKKATGLDNILPKLVKIGANQIAYAVTILINHSLRTGQIPKSWKSAKVIPIHKSGKKDITNNYRPISVLPVLSNVLEKVVYKQLYEYLLIDNLL